MRSQRKTRDCLTVPRGPRRGRIRQVSRGQGGQRMVRGLAVPRLRGILAADPWNLQMPATVRSSPFSPTTRRSMSGTHPRSGVLSGPCQFSRDQALYLCPLTRRREIPSRLRGRLMRHWSAGSKEYPAKRVQKVSASLPRGRLRASQNRVFPCRVRVPASESNRRSFPSPCVPLRRDCSCRECGKSVVENFV
jgi:hypothetical protein